MVTLKEISALIRRTLRNWIMDDTGVADGDLVKFNTATKALMTSGKKSTDFQSANSLLSALAALVATGGLVAKTGAATVAARTLSKTGNGITVSNGDGAAGNPTVALSTLLEAFHALVATGGLVAKTGAGTVAARTLSKTGNGITVSNGDGAAGNPTVALSTLLEAFHALVAAGGFVAKTAAGTVAARTLSKTGNGIAITNGDGVAGDPVFSLDIGTGSTQISAGNHAHDSVYTSLTKRTYIYADRITSHASIGTTGSYQPIPLNGVLYSNGDGGSYSTSTYIFQPSRAGIFHFCLSVASDNSSASVLIYWYNSGGSVLGGFESAPSNAPNSGSNYHPAISGTLKMAATDYVKILIRVSSVTTQTVRYSNGTFFTVAEF